MNIIIWLGIIFCLSQSAMFSGLNLAFFSITRLRLEIEVANNNKAAHKVLKMRSDSNFLLTTILLGEAIKKLNTDTIDQKDDRIKKDIILLWGDKKQIITGSDILGRLLRGIISSKSLKPNR